MEKQIIEKAIEMRKLQKEYFRKRDALVLAKAKQAERELDKLLESYKNPSLW